MFTIKEIKKRKALGDNFKQPTTLRAGSGWLKGKSQINDRLWEGRRQGAFWAVLAMLVIAIGLLAFMP